MEERRNRRDGTACKVGTNQYNIEKSGGSVTDRGREDCAYTTADGR
jgi:hypothetical protein